MAKPQERFTHALRLDELEDLLDDLTSMADEEQSKRDKAAASPEPPRFEPKVNTPPPAASTVPKTAPKQMPENMFKASHSTSQASLVADLKGTPPPIVPVEKPVLAPQKQAPASSLSLKMDELVKEREDVEKQISHFTKLKSEASTNEDYEMASKYKKDVERLEGSLKLLNTQIQKLKDGIAAESKLRANAAPPSPPSSEARKNLEAAYQRKKAELAKLKDECAHNEDYEGANHYKRQMEIIEENFKKDLARIESGMPVQSVIVSTPGTGSTTFRPPAATVKEKPLTLRETVKKKQASYPQDSKPYEAARTGRIADVKKILSEGSNVNAVDFNTGNTALHAAVTGMSNEMITFLVDNGADCNYKNRKGQTPLHLSCEKLKRMDEMTQYMIKKGNADLYVKDNFGQTPLDMTGIAAKYYQELKEWYQSWMAAKPPEEPEVNVVEGFSEAIQIYLRSGSYYTFVISDQDTVNTVRPLVADKLKVSDLATMIDVCEEVMGKDRVLKLTDKLLEVKGDWPNQNPTYCKFKVKLQRGAPGPAQMKFREALYG